MSVVARPAGRAAVVPAWRRRAASTPFDQQSALATAAVGSYVALWILEGAFRKWVPVTGSLMYVARDGLLVVFAIVQYCTAPRRSGSIPSLAFWAFVSALVVLAAVQTVLLGVPLTLVVLGLRNYIAPFAFAYFFWRFWRSKSRLMIVILLLAVPLELAVTALQVASPATAFVNLTVSGDATGLGNAGGVVRGNGTFSDAGTLATFCTIMFALCLGLLADPVARFRRRWLYLALAGVIGMMALAGERTAIFGSAVVLIVWLLRELIRADFRSLTVVGAVLGAAAVMFGVALLAFPKVLAAFGDRFVSANQQENSAGRVLDSAIGFLTTPLTPIGSGVGSHSNAAIALGGSQMWIETELDRWVAELGALGLVIVLCRLALGIVLGARVVFGLTTLSSLTVALSCVVGPQLVAGSISVNPATEGAAAVGFALLLWSMTAQARRPDPGHEPPPAILAPRARPRWSVGR